MSGPISQGAQAASAQQQAHTQHRSTLRIEIVPADRKRFLPHHREQNPTRSDHQVPGLGKDGREQRRLAANIPNPLNDRRVVHQISRPQRRKSFRVRLGKVHARIMSADTRNDSPFRTNTASRPNHAATTPPIVAPSTRFIDHVVDERVFATITSSRAVMFGMTELRAGSKNAAIIVSASSSGYTNQTRLRDESAAWKKR